MLFPNCEVGACPDETTLRIFLEEHREPMRLAVLDRQGLPQIATLWFRYEAGALWGVSHAEAWLTRRLQRVPKVGLRSLRASLPTGAFEVRGPSRCFRTMGRAAGLPAGPLRNRGALPAGALPPGTEGSGVGPAPRAEQSDLLGLCLSHEGARGPWLKSTPFRQRSWRAWRPSRAAFMPISSLRRGPRCCWRATPPGSTSRLTITPRKIGG